VILEVDAIPYASEEEDLMGIHYNTGSIGEFVPREEVLDEHGLPSSLAYAVPIRRVESLLITTSPEEHVDEVVNENDNYN
jgi:hypothetical protein